MNESSFICIFPASTVNDLCQDLFIYLFIINYILISLFTFYWRPGGFQVHVIARGNNGFNYLDLSAI